MNTQEFFQRVYQSDAWQQLRQATHTKYLFWFRRYTEFLCQHNVAELSAQQKIIRFLSQDDMESAANTKRQATSAIKWVSPHQGRIIGTPYISTSTVAFLSSRIVIMNVRDSSSCQVPA